MNNLIEVVTKSDGDLSYSNSGGVELIQPSIVTVPLGPEDVVGFEQQGENLVIDLASGEQEVIYNFFETVDGVRHDLVLKDAQNVFWWGQYDSPWVDFTFAEIQGGVVPSSVAGGGMPPLWALAMGAVTTAVAVDAIMDGDTEENSKTVGANSDEESSDGNELDLGGDAGTDEESSDGNELDPGGDAVTDEESSDGNELDPGDDAGTDEESSDGNELDPGDDAGTDEESSDGNELDPGDDAGTDEESSDGNELDPGDDAGTDEESSDDLVRIGESDDVSLVVISLQNNYLEIGGLASPIPKSQTLTGTAIEGVAIELLSQDGNILGDAVADENGEWQIVTDNALPPTDALFDTSLGELSSEEYTISAESDSFRTEVPIKVAPPPVGVFDNGKAFVPDSFLQDVNDERGGEDRDEEVAAPVEGVASLSPEITFRNNDVLTSPSFTVIKGKAQPGENVLLYKKGNEQLELIKASEVGDSSTFDITIEPALEDGASYVLYTAASDFSEFSAPVNFLGDTTPPDKLVLGDIAEIDDESVLYEGSAEPDALVVFFEENNSKILGMGEANSEGNFSIVSEKAPDGPGFYGNGYVFDSYGNYSERSVVFNSPRLGAVFNQYEGRFSLDQFDSGQGSVQGTVISGQVIGVGSLGQSGSLNVQVALIDASGEVLGTSTDVSRSGDNANQFEIITDIPLMHGNEYDLVVLLDGEIVSLPTKVEGDTVAPNKPVIDDVSSVEDDNGNITTIIQGQADQESSDGGLFVLGPDGEYASSFAFPNDNGNFQLEVQGDIDSFDGYNVYAYDRYRNVSDSTTIGEVVIEDVYNVFGFDDPEPGSEGTLVEGITRPGDLVELRDPDTGDILGVARADENTGEFTLKTSRVLENDVSYSVSSVDKNGSISIASSVVGDTVAPDALSIALEEDEGVDVTDNDGNLFFPETFTDGITGNTTVNVSGIEEGADWYWKASPDEEWIKGEGNSFDLADVRDDKYYNLFTPIVKQVDSYGNVSESADLTADYSQRIIDFTASLFLNDELNNRAPIGEDGEAGGARILLEGEVVYLNSENGLGSGGGTIDFVGPVVLDVDKDGDLSYSDNEVALPCLGGVTTAWGGAGDGVLMWDINGDTTLTDLEQIAFTEFGGETDLEGLAIGFDSNGDGVFDANDDAFDQFGVWQDADSNGELDAGEFLSLEDVGIVAINLESDGVESQPADGVHEFGRGSAVLADGSEMLLSDVAFDYKPFSEDEQNALSVI